MDRFAMWAVLSFTMNRPGCSHLSFWSMRQMMSTISGTTLRIRSSGHFSSASPMTVWLV